MRSSAPERESAATVGDRTEAGLIAIIQSHLAPPPSWLTVGIGDDAAVVEPAKNCLDVLTVDAIVDGIHVDRRFTPPDAIGHRALAVNLSDLAAMGAEPRLALLSLALPPALPCDDFVALVEGLTRLAREHRVHLVGGNLTRTPGPLVVDITASGTVKRRKVLTRSGARPGDEVYVSGGLGAAAAGLGELRAGMWAAQSGAAPVPAAEPTVCARRYLYPEPRVRLGTLLGRNRAATSCVDLSDGLADGVARIAAASGVGITIDADALPIAPAARSWFDASGTDPTSASVTGGDDYELLFTVRPRLRGRLRTVARHCGTTLTRIGVCTSDRQLILRRMRDGVVADLPMPEGYHHFG
jgi:thiamine-monophosphate kinase